MAEQCSDRAALLRREFHSQTARIHWRDLQAYFAHGNVVSVSGDLDLVEVAVQLGLDNTEDFQRWIAQGEVAPVSDEQALQWHESDTQLWAVVAPPWILVQQVAPGPR
ncbi:MAG: DUF2288 domain-containing protein [Halioglobus sp.]|nr:DUF2288 domain-containing protein [Halioglobus sp.]